MKKFILITLIVFNVVFLAINIISLMISTLYSTPEFNNKSPFVIDAIVSVDSTTNKYIDYQHHFFTKNRTYFADITCIAPKGFNLGDTLTLIKHIDIIDTSNFEKINIKIISKPIVKDTIKKDTTLIKYNNPINIEKDSIITNNLDSITYE